MNPNEPSAEVLAKLDQATAARQSGAATTAPPPPEPVQHKEATVIPSSGSVTDGAPTGAGSGMATYLLVDHYIGGSAGTLWWPLPRTGSMSHGTAAGR